jgi:hypothetical protein
VGFYCRLTHERSRGCFGVGGAGPDRGCHLTFAISKGGESLPAIEGAELCLLTGMSLLALLGLRYPIKMLAILVFEVIWKVLWLGIVALPHLIADDMNEATADLLFNLLFVTFILAVTPWDYVWKHYLKAHGDIWGRTAQEFRGADA